MVLMVGSITGTIWEKKEVFPKPQFVGATIITWRFFSFNRVDSLVFISTKMNSEAYKEVLEDYVFPNVVD